MSPIEVTASDAPITVSASGTKIDALVSGGQGPQGSSASITVGTVTTGAPGSSASVVNAGSSSAAVLNFTIPAGAAGAAGPQGEQGIQGPAGATGATGPAGTTSWAGITDKPSTFSPSSHQHVAADITDFTSAVIAAAPPTTNASLLTSGTLPDARLSSAIARTSDITAAVANVVNAAPASLDTLKELADALGNDASFATTVTNALASKAPLASPTFTGTVSGVTKAHVGLGNVDNTSDASKPVSTATQAALDAKAALVHTHTVSAITDAGTAATRNVPATGNAGATEVVLGSDTRLTDARTPTSHAHGNINTLGQVASTLDASAVGGPVVFGALAGTIGRGQFGTSAGTVCQGNDSRLSDARTPTAHKSSHATGGSDALSPADIGASAVGHAHPATDITSGTFDVARIPSLPASQITSGTLDAARIPSLPASQITSGTLDVARVPSLPGSQIGSGTVAVARLPTVLEQTVTVGNSGTSTTLSLTNGSVQTVTLNGNCTFTMPTAAAGASLTLILTQSGTFTASFTGVLWAGGTAPTITATANKVDVLVFVSNGTSWYGTAAQNF